MSVSPELPAGAYSQLSHYAGFDWAKDQHQIAVVDQAGEVLLELSFPNTASGWAQLREAIAPFPRLGVAIETSCGVAVDRLLEMGLAVYPLNPKAAERYRDRKRPGGGKSDPLDAWCFADALRSDGHGWRELLVQDPLTAELRLLCRDEIHLIEQRTALVNQLQAALYEYYPAALAAFDDWTKPWTWDFVLLFPMPQQLASAGKRKWTKFLHTPQALPNSDCRPAARAVRRCAAVRQQAQLDEYRSRIERLFADHPDHDLFGSLPGAGPKLAPRLLGEIGANRNLFRQVQDLQCYAGTAPVSYQSGRTRVTLVRWACNKYLRATVHLWAGVSRLFCAWAEAYYQKKKKQGMSHAAALRCLGQRWLKILFVMWQNHACYDEALHTRNQVRHGSWVIALLSSQSPERTTKTANPK